MLLQLILNLIMVEDKDPVESAIEKLKPVLSKLSFGAIAGYTSGYATKKIGKAAAFVAGVGFIIFQSLAVAGYIDIDWLKIKDDAVKSIDTVRYFFIFHDCLLKI